MIWFKITGDAGADILQVLLTVQVLHLLVIFEDVVSWHQLHEEAIDPREILHKGVEMR